MAINMTILLRRSILVCDRPAYLTVDDHLLGIIACNALRHLVGIGLGDGVGWRDGGLLMSDVCQGVPMVAPGGMCDWVAVGSHSIFGAGFVQRVEPVTATLVAQGTLAGVRGSVTPAGVAGDHEGFEAGDGAGDNAVVFLDLHPEGCHHGVKGWIG